MNELPDTIPLGEEPWNDSPDTLPSNFNFDQSQAALSQSERILDMTTQAEQAKQQADALAKPASIAKQTAKSTLGTIADTGLKFLGSALNAPTDIFNQLRGKPVNTEAKIAGFGGPQQTIQGQFASETIPSVEQGTMSPLMGTAKTVGQTALGAVDALGAKGLTTGIKSVAPKAGNLLSKVVSPITKPIANYLAQRTEKKAVDSLTKTLMPKLDAKEVRLALRDGRIAPGRNPSLLRGGTPDEIMPSENTKKSATTIRQYIKDSEKMKAPELHTALGEQVKNMGSSLRPVMDTTKITPKTVGKITKDWEALKAKQLADPYTPDTANVQKLQSSFEDNFLKKSKSGNFGDLWDTRAAYDASVPSNVKNATSLSSDTLQTQKELWLQNRRILNDAINDSSSGLGDVSQKTFAEMNDLYNAQRGIESSFKPVKESTPSKIKQFAKDHPYITGAGLLGANKASKETTGVSIPTPF